MSSEDHADGGWIFLKIMKNCMCEAKPCAPRISSRCKLQLHEHLFGTSSTQPHVHRQLPPQSAAVITADKLGITMTAKPVDETPIWTHGAPWLGAGAARRCGIS